MAPKSLSRIFPDVFNGNTKSDFFYTPIYDYPPPACRIDDFPDEESNKIVMLYEIGAGKIADNIRIDLDDWSSQLNITITNELANLLNYSQLYYIQCNLMWMLMDFIGDIIDQNTEQIIKYKIPYLIEKLISAEVRPGDFGNGVIDKYSIMSKDFDLENWE